MKGIIRRVTVLLLGLALLPALPAYADAPQPLAALVDQALANNPQLQAAEARWRMNEHKVAPARTLDDPVLSFDFSNYPIDSFSGDETPMTGKDLKLSQKFPFPGKLAAKGEMAKQQALWYRGSYEDARLQIVKKVKDAYYRLFFLDKATAITNQNIAILDDFIQLTQTRYQVGKGLQANVLKAQVERSKLMDQLFAFKQRRTSALGNLNSLLGRPTGTPVATAAELAMTPVKRSLAELQREAEQQRPMFASYKSLVERFRAQRHLGKLDYLPDFNLWAGYRQREAAKGDPVNGTDFASIGISINLPLWQKKRAEGVAEAESGIRMALQQYDDFRNQVDFAIQDDFAKMEKNRDLTSLYQTGIIPQADQTYQASLTAYQVDKVDFLTLLDSLLTLYHYKIDYFRVLSDYQQNVAALAAAAGVDPSLPPAGEPAPGK